MPVDGIRLEPAVLPHSAQALREEVREFIAGEMTAGRIRSAPDNWLGGFDAEFSRKLGARGWLGMTGPKQYGGHERSALERFVVTEELLAAGAPVAAHWVGDRQTGPSLLRYGTERQREEFLPRLAAGELFFAIGMSEPGSGSDLASVRTQATRVADGWRVTGTKLWSSNAHRLDYFFVLCRTEPPSEDRHAGLSQLIVDLNAPGVTVRPVPILTGEHHFNEVIMDDVFVPDEGVLGTIGKGWQQVTSELAYERSGPERFLSTLPALTAFLAQLGAHELDDRTTVALGEITADVWTLRALSMSVAAALDRGEAPDVQAALVKDLGTRFEGDLIELLRRLADTAPSLLAGPGLDLALAESFLHLPGFTLRGGLTSRSGLGL